jgi:hypothetical protein
LVRIAEERFGTRRVSLLGSVDARERLSEMAVERGLDLAEERQR